MTECEGYKGTVVAKMKAVKKSELSSDAIVNVSMTLATSLGLRIATLGDEDTQDDGASLRQHIVGEITDDGQAQKAGIQVRY